jgi:fused signal recognition particle receptor
MGIFQKIKDGLGKTRQNIVSGVDNALRAFVRIDDELFDELEEALILADIGAVTAGALIERLRERVKQEKIKDGGGIKRILAEEIGAILSKGSDEFVIKPPSILLIIGVNGVGKTTSVGKLANIFRGEGKSVVIAAADTFRAAAVEQLQIWGERAGVPVIKNQDGTDPASVVFDAIASAKAKKTDVLLVDTAGRLQNKKNLMEEMRKISKIISREYPEANVETLLVLDAATGQNALSQARAFGEVADVNGIILTKIDGTAKGGIVIAIMNELNLPVRYIGVGEGIDDLQIFDAGQFARALFEGYSE